MSKYLKRSPKGKWQLPKRVTDADRALRAGVVILWSGAFLQVTYQSLLQTLG